ncbi:MAG: trypsin-like peptidase domain-containing protein [Planctomycetia bacterium]|nr:trypsin-like peptidase domain-containing protein [Planctomycetia bacterium]
MGFYGLAVAVCALSGIGETTLLDFQADWCGPCRSMQPVVERLQAAGYPVRTVNIDNEKQLAAQYGVSSIPCFVVVVDGRERSRIVGATSEQQLRQMLAGNGVEPVANRDPNRPRGLGMMSPGAGNIQGGSGAIPTVAPTQPIVRGQSPDGPLRRFWPGRRAADPAPPAAATAGGPAGGPAGAMGGIAPPVVSVPMEASAPPRPGESLSGAAPPAPPASPFNAPPASPAPAFNSPAFNSTAPGSTDLAALPSRGAAIDSAPSAAGPSGWPAAASSVSWPAKSDGAAVAGNADTTPLEARLLAASVRIRVEDAGGHSFGSGTIIDQRSDPSGNGGEALVLTCGHLFRDSQGHGAIRIDRFDALNQQSVEGRLLKYDLARDIALVTFRTEAPVKAIRLAPLGHQSRQGESVVSVGCDNAHEPSVRRSRITQINSFVGPPNIQVDGQPAVGRSGGGLFDEQGRLVGVCNFADPQDKAGLFADVASAHEVLDQAGLAAISRSSAVADNRGAVNPASPPPMASEMPGGTRPTAGAIGEPLPPGAALAAATAVGSSIPPRGPVEVICVVRNGSGPTSRNETIIISNASTELLSKLADEQRTAQSAFPTSLAVPKPAAAVQAPNAAPLQPEAVERDTPPAARTSTTWQPQWR